MRFVCVLFAFNALYLCIVCTHIPIQLKSDLIEFKWAWFHAMRHEKSVNYAYSIRNLVRRIFHRSHFIRLDLSVVGVEIQLHWIRTLRKHWINEYFGLLKVNGIINLYWISPLKSCKIRILQMETANCKTSMHKHFARSLARCFLD